MSTLIPMPTPTSTPTPTPAPSPPVTKEISLQFLTLISNAFGIVAALAWSDALTKFFEKVHLFKAAPIMGPFVYAAIITLVAYLASKLMSAYVQPPCTRLCDTPKPRA